MDQEFRITERIDAKSRAQAINSGAIFFGAQAVAAAASTTSACCSGAQWILSELVSLAEGIGGDDAARLVALAQMPVGELVESFNGRQLVHADLTVPEEVLVVLASHYPDAVPLSELTGSLDRRAFARRCRTSGGQRSCIGTTSAVLS